MMTDNTEAIAGVNASVTDPQHHGEGRGKYTSYLVEVDSPKKTACRRRYSDFQWLYQRLLAERPGAIVPIIPHTKALTHAKRFSEELVSKRKDVLQEFLIRVLQHPELYDAPSLAVFLTADHHVWEAAKKQHEITNIDEDASETSFAPAAAGAEKTAGSRISNWMGKVRSKIALAGGVDLESTPDDDIFQELQAYATSLETNIKVLAKESTAMVAAMKTTSEKMETMGGAFSALGEYKLDNQVIVRTNMYAMYTKLGQNWNNLGKLTNFQYQSACAKLDDPLQDMARDAAALRIAITARKEVLYEYTRKAHQGKTKMSQLDKFRENPPANLDKITLVESEVRTLKQDIATLWKEVDVVTKRLTRDVERFKEMFKKKMRSTMETFHTVQTEYAEKYVQGWKDVLPYVQDAQMQAPVAPPPMAAPPAIPDASAPSLTEEENAPITTVL